MHSYQGMISSTTWSLTEMCKTHLSSERQEIDTDETAGYFDGSVSSPDRLLNFVKHCELDAHYQMAIASRVQILPLTKQLTNLAGNAWNKTLNGGRAERNEYILLHEFHRLKYICPDKTWGKKTIRKIKEHEDDEDGVERVRLRGKAKRDKYKGGLVFEPKRGLWDRYVLVMDFNSLYPSIIQEYNIDFTTVSSNMSLRERGRSQNRLPRAEQGVLPRLIATLVNRRRQVKSLMKDKTASKQKLLQWDIKQMALKLTANSMYGCLGFEYSRFYARPLAALTTYKGREILTHTRELAESLGLDVVYGDTDSIFVNTNATLSTIGTNCWRLTWMGFRAAAPPPEEEYAAVKVNEGSKTTSIEIKGLDMKRREFSTLSKNVSQYVLDQILSGEMTEIVVEKIHEYLRSRLGKNPEDYPDGKSQPHVQVALRMKSKGGNARVGDVISYVFCLGSGGESSKTGQADRARHPDEVRKADTDCQIGNVFLLSHYDYYLAQQILPPIERLCERIEGTDRSRLAECLGLDPARFRSYSTAEGEEMNITTLDSQIPESERYNDADPLKIRCRQCKAETEFAPIHDRQVRQIPLVTPGTDMPKLPQSPRKRKHPGAVGEADPRTHIEVLPGWTVCDDSMWEQDEDDERLREECLRSGCTGRVTFEYSDTKLYNQLRYYAYLFDGEAALKCSRGAEHEDEVRALATKHAEFLSTLNRTVKRFLDENARRWVDMQSFSRS
ncbi:hypothetical protein BJ322DRAFT_1115131 [Thelephora terrestris]|uniref:DNA polymerase n=1 Tax=Thelephora terrestris TaxID=56493 RepID=A0A9P6H286_9AGAM|nr:hypothetical protein BJ322DRAFT_1115131 [Thelephora terrestris]